MAGAYINRGGAKPGTICPKPGAPGVGRGGKLRGMANMNCGRAAAIICAAAM
jgi:hypothetical protein